MMIWLFSFVWIFSFLWRSRFVQHSALQLLEGTLVLEMVFICCREVYCHDVHLLDGNKCFNEKLSLTAAGLLAYIVEKFQTWGDCKGDVDSRFTMDEVGSLPLSPHALSTASIILLGCAPLRKKCKINIKPIVRSILNWQCWCQRFGIHWRRGHPHCLLWLHDCSCSC